MTPAEGGRFCGDCKKVVRDLSSMTEAEARALLTADRNERLCVRYLHDRDGRVVFADRALVPASFLHRAKRLAALAPLALAACSVPGFDHEEEVVGDIAYVPDASADADAGDTDAAGAHAHDATPDVTPDASPDTGPLEASDASDDADPDAPAPDGGHPI